jgi:hypothetical protein
MFLVDLKISVLQHFPFLGTVSTNNSKPYHLVLFLLDVTFTTVTTDFTSACHKTNSAFCCMVHVSPDTDLHWEVKLTELGKSDGWPCAQVVLIGQPTKAS